MKTVDLIAHRGESVDAPENTLAAFRLAWERGAVGIEGDFRLNADGEIVCMHDGNARRTTGVDLEISTATSAEVAALDAGLLKGEQWKGEGVPTLRQVLGTIPRHGRILLEIKDRPHLVPVLKRELEASVAPQIEQAERVEQRRPGPASRTGLPVRYDVVRTGMTTWT